MTPALRRRLHAVVSAVPVGQRDQHLTALSGLLHLLEHGSEGHEPRGFVAGYPAYRLPPLRWAAEVLEQAWIDCTSTNRVELGHVTLLNEPVTGEAHR